MGNGIWKIWNMNSDDLIFCNARMRDNGTEMEKIQKRKHNFSGISQKTIEFVFVLAYSKIRMLKIYTK